MEIDYFNLDLFKYLMYTDISVSSFDVSCIIYVYDTDDGFSEVSTFCVCVCVLASIVMHDHMFCNIKEGKCVLAPIVMHDHMFCNIKEASLPKMNHNLQSCLLS